MEQYYIIENETKKGPFSLKELIELNLPETTLVWKIGLKDWTELKNISEYKKTIPPPIPQRNTPIESEKPVPSENKNIEKSKISKDNSNIDIKVNSKSKNTEALSHSSTGFLLRLVAFIIDLSIMFFITSFFWAILRLPIPVNSESFFSGSYFVFRNPLGIILGWLYYASFESSKLQATPGKAILGLKVTNENLDRIGFSQASGRFFGKIISGLIIGIGYLMIGFTKKEQGLHDLMAHTLVLKESITETKRKRSSWIILSISIMLFIFSLFIPANTEMIDTLNSLATNSNTSNTSTNNVKNLSFDYQGISFDYPNNWKVEKEEVQQNLAYQVYCEKKGINSSETILFSLLNIKTEPREMIQTAIEGIKEEPTCKKIKIKPIYTVTYNDISAIRSDLNFLFFGEKQYVSIISFISNDKTILIMKQTESIAKLTSEFKIIENSLKIE